MNDESAVGRIILLSGFINTTQDQYPFQEESAKGYMEIQISPGRAN